MIEGLAPSGYMRYAPDGLFTTQNTPLWCTYISLLGHFVFASFASAFLLKVSYQFTWHNYRLMSNVLLSSCVLNFPLSSWKSRRMRSLTSSVVLFRLWALQRLLSMIDTPQSCMHASSPACFPAIGVMVPLSVDFRRILRHKIRSTLRMRHKPQQWHL